MTLLHGGQGARDWPRFLAVTLDWGPSDTSCTAAGVLSMGDHAGESKTKTCGTQDRGVLAKPRQIGRDTGD